VSTTAELVAEGRRAVRGGDAAAARRCFEAALATGTSGDAVEGMAQVAYLELDHSQAIECWERAYAAHRSGGDRLGAVRVARTLSCMHATINGDWAVASGWLSRASTLAGDTDSAELSAERGWIELNVGMFEPDRLRKDQHLRAALGAARRLGDVDLELVSLAYLGASLVHGGQTDDGMAMLDEALAAVAGGDADDFFVLEEIFCQLFSACEHARDVSRADQWIRVGEAIAERRKLPAVSAFCRTHYGGVLTDAGRWPEAEVTLVEAVRLWGLGRRSQLRAGASARLAELRVRQGRLEEAEQLLADVDVGAEPAAARARAAIHLARGDCARAGDVLERSLAVVGPSSQLAAPLLSLLVDAHLAAGRVGDAEAVSRELDQCARAHPSHYLIGLAALARGKLCIAACEGDPRPSIQEAVDAFGRAQMPSELAHARLVLAAALSADRPDVAIDEARAALEVFEGLRATRDADAAAAVLRGLGIRTHTSRRGGELLTSREAEVLELLGAGLSNPEIADRLFISRKTVEHHVGNVLSKLALRSRAEAAVYAMRWKPAER